MQRLLWILVCLTMFLAMAGVATANLVANGDFMVTVPNPFWPSSQPEYLTYPSMTGWDVIPSTTSSFYQMGTVAGGGAAPAYPGVPGGYVAFCGVGTVPDAIGQTIPTTPGASYYFSFWMYSPNLTPGYYVNPGSFAAYFGGVPASGYGIEGTPVWSVNGTLPSGAPEPEWTDYTFIVTATGSSTYIGFASYAVTGTTQVYGMAVADVSVDPVPVPPALLLMGSGLLGLVGWRRFRKG